MDPRLELERSKVYQPLSLICVASIAVGISWASMWYALGQLIRHECHLYSACHRFDSQFNIYLTQEPTPWGLSITLLY